MKEPSRRPKDEAIRGEVRRYYAAVVGDGAQPPAGAGCCGSTDCRGTSELDPNGYAAADLASEASIGNLGLGCGNPVGLASLHPGESVLDLGSGAGFDCFLAAQQVGKFGQVIGVDMTPEMISRARSTASRHPEWPVEFRLGEIEHLPVLDASIDAVISNCVVNLSPQKQLVVKEAFRVLKPGGRLAIADIVSVGELSPEVRNDLSRYVECISGAIGKHQWQELLAAAGFEDVAVDYREEPRSLGVASALIRAAKPPRLR